MKSDKMQMEDLLSDESFVNYCKRSSPEDVAFWESYITENPDQRLLVERANEKFVQLFNALAEADVAQEETRLRKSLQLIQSNSNVVTAESGKKKSNKILLLVLKLTAAAAVLIMGVLFVINYHNDGNNRNTRIFQAALGERKNIQLPDGSQVILNGGSKIKINEGFDVATRDIYLEGEAFFNVKHNAKIPFIVHTPVMDIKALGTAFNVKAYLDEEITEASLISGLVEVRLKEEDDRIVLLHPNEKVKWEHVSRDVNSRLSGAKKEQPPAVTDSLLKKISVTNSGDIQEIAWKENKLVFEDESLGNIATLLERWYGVKIEFTDAAIRNYRFTGTFENEDINTVLDFLKESRSFTYKAEPENSLKIKLSK